MAKKYLYIIPVKSIYGEVVSLLVKATDIDTAVERAKEFKDEHADFDIGGDICGLGALEKFDCALIGFSW